MAKEYYTVEEAADVLGVTPADVDQLVNDGRLLQYERGGQIVFRVEDVERLVAKEGSSMVNLSLDEADGKPGATPGGFEATSDINLLGLDESSVDLDLGPSPTMPVAPQARSGPAKPPAKEIDTLAEPSDLDLAPLDDLGLSASGVISLDDDEKAGTKTGSRAGSKAGAKAKEDTKITSVGISVFDDSDLQIDTDPMAKTQISKKPADNELAMESIGSGSGLLDLTREKDDTSLGAELLDVISPSESAETETQAEPIDSDTGTLDAEAVETAEAVPYTDAEEAVEDEQPASAMAMAPMVAVAADPMAPAFTGLAVVSTLALAIAGLAATSQIQGVWPAFMGMIDRGSSLLIFFGALLLLAGAAWGVGFMVGKPKGPRAAKAPKAAKPQKGKKGKAAPEAEVEA